MRYAILTFIFALLTTPVQADERFLPYIDWLVANSNYQYNGEALPTIEFLPYKVLEVEVYGPEQVAQAEMNGTELPRIEGAYNDDENVMWFPEGTDPWSREDTIVHELFHFLQYINGESNECVPALERPAYEAHWKWVEEHGKTDVYEEPNWLFVFMLEMACRNPYEYR